MTLSRTARFLIAALLVAAAAFVWVADSSQDPLAPATLANDPTAPVALADPSGSAPAAGVPQATETVTAGEVGVGVAATDAAASPASANTVDAASDAATSAGTVAGSPSDTPAAASGVAVAGSTNAPAVVVTDAPSVATRDLVVDVLPFLVTSPPQAGASAIDADADGANRPQLGQRSSINPFSPVVVQAPPSAPSNDVLAQNAPPPSESPVIEVVEAPSGPTPTQASAATQGAAGPPTPVAAPAPRALTPNSMVTTNLPRALPSGMLPTTPEILRDTRSQANLVTPVVPDLAALATLKEPGQVQQDVPLQAIAAGIPSDDVVTPDIIGVPQPRESAVASGSSLPLAVGADPLSRYLRDNDVRFTGTVLGPLSVGVFRSTLYGSPVVLTLGQTLPETDIILSDLRGYEARFLLGDRTQTLSLDLRR